MKDKEKIRLAVRVYLCANAGKWFNAKALSEFVNQYGFGGRYGVTTTSLSKMMDRNWLQGQGIKRQRKDRRNVWEYSVVEI